MQKKTLSIGLVLTSSLLLAGCTIPFAPTTSSPQTPGQTMSEATKFAKAIESGTPTTCTLTKGADTMEYFIKGKMMRTNTATITTDAAGKTTTVIAHMINDTQSLYIWSDDQKQGSKMPIPSPLPSATPIKTLSEPQASAPQLGSEADYQAFQNEGYTINCKPGVSDSSVFTAPADIKFIDPTEMMRQIPSPAANGQVDMQKIQELQKQYGGQ